MSASESPGNSQTAARSSGLTDAIRRNHHPLRAALDEYLDGLSTGPYHRRPAVTYGFNTGDGNTNGEESGDSAGADDDDTDREVKALLVSSIDGTPVLRAFGTAGAGSGDPHDTGGMSDALLGPIESVFVVAYVGACGASGGGAGGQLGNLGLGRCRWSTAYYAGVVLVHVSFYPLVLTFVASPTANVGAILSSLPRAKAILAPLRDAVLGQQYINGASDGRTLSPDAIVSSSLDQSGTSGERTYVQGIGESSSGGLY
eukprot:CAMPEP_0194291274 /NCGR_PEP_ID=MMETSP0169-20130528/43085_1 /TAXON_ID=218684 /ORGANISM="Corethron pennatum, Strain L29A3" /LENGTH=257 /DNA_ID=CAMNT_0039039105 /DNA_START=44 /DNA_END=817 /DNA_ORIENTATION=+